MSARKLSRYGAGSDATRTGVRSKPKGHGRLQRLEDELAQASKENEQLRESTLRLMNDLCSHRELFAMIAHDLRAPLSIIVAAVAELRRDMAFDPETRRMVDFVDDSAGRALRLCGDLTDVAALHSGLFRVNPMEADVVAFARRAFDAVHLSHGPQPCMIFSAPKVPVAALVDPQRLTQMLVNLLTNAARHAHACVRLTVCATAQDAILIVEDDGDGIEVLPTGTVRARAGATRPRSGLGLGLPIVRGIVHAHGGTLHVLNGVPDGSSGFCGARFVIRLPRRARA